MFTKPFKVKSNNQLKGTERKKLCEEVLQAFPSLKEDEVQNLLRKKDVITVLKIVTHSGKVVRVFCSGKTPLFFQLDLPTPILYPTIFTLWQHPDLLYNFTMHSAIIQNLTNGADLMLPGVILGGPPTLHSYGRHQKGTMVSVNTKDNKAPVAVGLTALSSEDMYMAGGHGKCVEIIHVIGDTLCQMESSLKRPLIEHPVPNDVPTSDENSEPQNLVEEATEGVEKLEVAQNENDENQESGNEETNDVEEVEVKPEKSPTELMDELLEFCFLKACKISLKQTDLPMLSSNFFKNHVLTACPADQSLDVRQSSYKKLSVFLNSMEEKGVILTSTLKGVQSILSVKTDHQLLKNLDVTKEDLQNPNEIQAPVITEVYKVTSNVLPVVSKYGYEKGAILKRPEIRRIFHDYVKKEELQNGSVFKLNGPLAGIFQSNESVVQMKMEDGINKFIGKMTLMKEITIGDSNILHSGKLEPIDITVSTRCNRKKVTLVNNLEMFGIKLDKFREECQEIGASASITDVPGKKTPSVLVQGNQVLYVYKLLTEKYRINKMYIRGLEFAPKKRK